MSAIPRPIYASSTLRFLAETVGFEPTDALTRQLISNQSRYSHFDTSPNQACLYYNGFFPKNTEGNARFIDKIMLYYVVE